MEIVQTFEKHLTSYILKENDSKEKENRKPKALRRTGEWRRFHTNEHNKHAVITSRLSNISWELSVITIIKFNLW